MAYQALYRKFRPPTFDDVRGQEHIVTTLRNQVVSGRVAHAYLFCGTRGTGKTSVAKILARAVNCEQPQNGNPCGECEVCRATAAGVNLNVVEIDAASNNGVDNIREIVDEVSYSPTMGHYKVYIIDEVHMLSTGAFNALLKTLEEPPEYVIFILATTEVQKIPITILSRCQRYDFHRLTTATIEERLREVAEKEGIRIEDRALTYIARSADGAMRDGLSLLDRCVAFLAEEELTYERVLDVLGTVDTEIFIRLFKTLYDNDVSAALTLISEVVTQGAELTQFVNDFVWFLRNLMLLHTSDAAETAIDVYAESYAQMKALCEQTSLDTILSYIRVFSELTNTIRFSTQKRILLETAIIRVCRPQAEDGRGDEAVSMRLAALERDMEKADRLLRGMQNGTIAVQGNAGGAGNTAAEPLPVKKLDRALPEDVKLVAKDWGRFLMGMQQPAKTCLMNAQPSLGENDELLIVADTELNARFFDEEEHRAELREYLNKFAGKEVSFAVRAVPEGRRFEEVYPSIGEAINFPLEQDGD